MLVGFRVDASHIISTGHVMRCLTLAKELQENGATCVFISRRSQSNLIPLIKKNGFDVLELEMYENNESAIVKTPNQTIHVDWLRANWESDASEVIKSLKGVHLDWLIIDHYGIDYLWEEKLRSHTNKIMVIDDLADRKHACDLLLDQNFRASTDNPYTELVPSSCTVLNGPTYALLQKYFKSLHKIAASRLGKIENILIYYGGTDSHNLTLLTLLALIKLELENIKIDIVVGSAYSFIDDLKNVVKNKKNISIHKDLDTLAPLILKSDVAIGAAGATSWERCCLGLPTLVITVAKNQELIADNLDRLGCIKLLGDHSEIRNQEFLTQILSNVFNNIKLRDMSTKCLELVDGLGAERVQQILMLDINTKLIARIAKPLDKDFLLNMRNENTLRSNSYPTDFISPDDHEIWFFNRLRNPDVCRIYIIETLAGLPIGQVRFDLEDDTWIICYSLARFAKGKNLTKKMLKLALRELYRGNPTKTIIGKIKSSNKTSQKILYDLGFTEINFVGGKSIGICSTQESWFFDSILDLIITWLAHGYSVNFTDSHLNLPQVDVALYLSYEKLIDKNTLKKHKYNVVIHSSDLPQGKGWSPLTWQILGGKNLIVNTLFEVDESIDGGPILDKNYIKYEGFELLDEIRDRQAKAIAELCLKFIENLPDMMQNKKSQKGKESIYRRRVPSDSQLDTDKTLAEQFNLLRVIDNERYPAFFLHRGHRYTIKISRDS